MEQCVASCRYRHPAFGAVRVKVHGTTRRMSARWVGQELCVTVPVNLPVEHYDRFLAEVQGELLARKPKPTFHIGRVIDAPEFDITIALAGATSPEGIAVKAGMPVRGKQLNYTIYVDPSLDDESIASPVAQDYINRNVIAVAVNACRRFVLPQARAMAESIGRKPLGWDIKESRTKLGSCSSKGIITLSPRLAFMPRELREFVIFHELAHLSEMNHSAAFHELCNRYCGGREAELSSAARKFRFPVY